MSGTAATSTAGLPGAHRTLLAAVLATVGMLFAAFTAAYLERRAGSDWGHVELPGLLWWNTGLILASSVALEVARRSRSRRWLRGALGLGGAFLVGQVLAWRELAATGVLLASAPHATFFYVLTAVHGVHLLGGIVALVAAQKRPRVFALCVGYWHFVGVVWLQVLAVLHLL